MLDLATDPSELALSCRFEVNFGDGPMHNMHGSDECVETGGETGEPREETGETEVEMTSLEDTAPTTQAAAANQIMAAVRENA